MTQNKIIIVQYHPDYAEETVAMWRDSKEQAICQKEIHSFESHVYFLNHILREQFQIDLALINDNVIGMIVYDKNEINQLYVHVNYQSIGIGQTLLDKVKAYSSGILKLSTFEINKKARQFYEKNCFKMISTGHENEENLPDIQYEWNCELIDE